MKNTPTPAQISEIAKTQQQEVVSRIKRFVDAGMTVDKLAPGKTSWAEISRVSGIKNVKVTISREQVTMFTLYRVILSISIILKGNKEASKEVERLWNEALKV